MSYLCANNSVARRDKCGHISSLCSAQYGIREQMARCLPVNVWVMMAKVTIVQNRLMMSGKRLVQQNRADGKQQQQNNNREQT